VASVTNESATAQVLAWLGQQASGTMAISDWVTAEFSAALSIKLRMGTVTLQNRAAALTAMARMSRDNFAILPVSAPCFSLAARFADHHETGLRAGDALHLAICAENGVMLCTLDQRLADAGSALGVQIQML